MTTVLTFDELANAKSVGEIVERYQSKGVNHENLLSILRAIATDWESARVAAAKEALASSDPLSVPHLDVIVNGQRYEVYGIAHDNVGPRYRGFVEDVVNSSTNWLCEQELLRLFPGAKGLIEVPDWSVNTFLETLVAEFDESMNNPIVGRDKSYKPLEVEEAEDDRHLETLRIPLEYWSDHLPAHVQLQLKGKTWRKRMGKMRGLKYSSIQRRSGYQASFLRYWKREGTKRILVGAAHAAEIAYFLKHEIRNPSIPGIAREHIHILETNPQEYATIAKRYMRRELRAALIAEGLSLGVRKTTSGLRRIQRRI